MEEPVRSVSPMCQRVLALGLRPDSEITPAHFGCENRPSFDATAACLQVRYQKFLEIAKINEPSPRQQELDERLARAGLGISRREVPSLFPEDHLASLGTALLGAELNIYEAIQWPEKYTYLFGPDAVGQTYVHMTGANIYLLCEQEFPSQNEQVPPSVGMMMWRAW